ncbi:MAG: NADH-quinone oxidoreductase subunit F [SAR202 cluster bacterium]|nr:NADH-quinone oxidoreductase subunit F [SAR202 cluster bacterium]
MVKDLVTETNTFEVLESVAKQRWEDLNSGSKPWIRIGTALCGEAAGSKNLLPRIQNILDALKIDANVSEVGCLGLCFAEPLLDIQLPGENRVFYRNVSEDDLEPIITSHIKDSNVNSDLAFLYSGVDELSDVNRLESHPMKAKEQRIALRNAGNIDPYDINQYIANGGYQALNKALSEMDSEAVLNEVKDSGLRGRGGAAFSTGIKWSFLASNDAPDKYILCNCEEGDPGAFNDKGILESDPHTVVEGVILAGYATKSNYGYIFIRHGHDGPIERTKNAIKQAYEKGLLGDNILGSNFSFNMEVALTGDSYVAGEETALMEAIEGKRSMPRYRPPFPAQVGVFGKPTNINNVKSLSYVPEIIRNGGQWFSDIGYEQSKGTAILCLSGSLKFTGMIEVPMGLNLKDVLYEVAGGVPGDRNLKLVQTGGPLGGVLNSENIDLVLDYETFRNAGAILGSGGIIAADDRTCIVDLTRSLIAFCQYESCGKCFPCRMGMSHLLEVLERICDLQGTEEDLDLMRNIGENMQAGSLCGHGQLGFNPVASAIKYFPEEFNQHIIGHTCLTKVCNNKRFSPTRTRR